MASTSLGSNRREFLRTGLASGAAALFATRFARAAATGAPAAPQPTAPAAPAAAPTRVALTNGDSRTDNVFRALKSVEKEVAQSIGNRRVVIKPNNVVTNNQLAATHADALTAICEFLKSIGKLDNAILAESPAMGSFSQGFQNYGYDKVAEKYKLKVVDLDQEKYQTIMAFDQTDAKPHPVRVSSILANQTDNFIISACMLKTHNYAVATMSIKNIVLGAPLKLPRANATAGGGGGRRGGGGGNDKTILHGGGSHGININLAMLAPMLHPSLAVIDGFEGMEGNGPISGTKVDHKVCVVSTDYLAADIVGANLMGIDPANIGYLTYLSQAKVGESDMSKMEILGEPVAKLAKKYQLGDSVDQQFQWKQAAKVAPAA
jgi:uncharacterized protein (DUF362 family)